MPLTIKPYGAGYQVTGTVTSGTTSEIVYVPQLRPFTGMTIAMSPSAGGSSLLKYSVSSNPTSGSAVWINGDNGTVATSVNIERVYMPLSAFTVTATGNDVYVEALV